LRILATVSDNLRTDHRIIDRDLRPISIPILLSLSSTSTRGRERARGCEDHKGPFVITEIQCQRGERYVRVFAQIDKDLLAIGTKDFDHPGRFRGDDVICGKRERWWRGSFFTVSSTATVLDNRGREREKERERR
jgi:hypothetical protein